MGQSEFRTIPDFQLRLQLRESRVRTIVRKIEQAAVRLDDIYYVNWGLRTGTDEKTARLITPDDKNPLAKRFIRGRISSTGISSSGEGST